MTILLVDSDKKALDREMWRFTQRPFAVTVSLHSSGDDAIRFSMCHDGERTAPTLGRKKSNKRYRYNGEKTAGNSQLLLSKRTRERR